MTRPDHEIIAAIETALQSAEGAQLDRVLAWMHSRFPQSKGPPVPVRTFDPALVPLTPAAPPWRGPKDASPSPNFWDDLTESLRRQQIEQERFVQDKINQDRISRRTGLMPLWQGPHSAPGIVPTYPWAGIVGRGRLAARDEGDDEAFIVGPDDCAPKPLGWYAVTP